MSFSSYLDWLLLAQICTMKIMDYMVKNLVNNHKDKQMLLSGLLMMDIPT